ncbi:S-adenosylmethionine:tRNA ribosyltransferase-isomerase [Parvularcula bermudensis HTCC2503]|uniref:S-adenosylmethionine:tRNA ribosyltransferase-isomerase n=1 Tax=Parvularcula bermudensis (strain ATCC BAA-594 / HTCC2503 / KCTC 12087) TaxID=314260 RepID=E0THV1_PARBH|nr:tRNA preQ1(34) S-adenosylmethionine ribosyltransferase-isomerase QueA [Parvularcula bermudensis]ADM10244.1 S-adenosylmethionine:tRNA ribosyltransferase-isomerase [Parvularcula bermudensis HTCC2503]
MRVDLFDYDLPEEQIALVPPPERDGARLLIVPPNGPFGHDLIAHLAEHFGPSDVLILNDTKVIPATLAGMRPARDVGGGDPAGVGIDITLLKCLEERDDGVRWQAFVRPAKRVRAGDDIEIGPVTARVKRREGAEAVLHIPLTPSAFQSFLYDHGTMPLPPYIARKRAVEVSDQDRYQTVFGKRPGSVAAPTAGLHFTDRLLSAIAERGATILRVTLHVGAGTFLPITAADCTDHRMHSEWGEVSPPVAERLRAAKAGGERITCVGTTALRIVETAAQSGEVQAFAGETDIFITPGFSFQCADRLLTNFHLPRSTLLMLVSAFSGRERILSAYREAINEGYRFFSYGDACLLERVS